MRLNIFNEPNTIQDPAKYRRYFTYYACIKKKKHVKKPLAVADTADRAALGEIFAVKSSKTRGEG